MKDNEITKRPNMDIFDRQFPVRLVDAPICDPTKFTILTGDDGILDDLFSYQVYNHIKNHWRAAAAPGDIQDGMIWSSTVGNKLYHEAGGADEEVLQLTRSSDVTPTFLGLLLAEYITHVGDANTYIRLEVDKISIRAGGIDLVNIGGKVFINDDLNADMTIGLTIQQAGNDDEILAFKSSDVGHGVTNYAETDTYGLFVKAHSTDGGVELRGLTGDERAINLVAYYTTDDTGKDINANAAIQFNIYKKAGAGRGNTGVDANMLAIKAYRGGNSETVWILDKDGDTWQDGMVTAEGIIFGSPTELTIAAGAITVTKGYHKVDGQLDAADNLDKIDGGADGMILVLRIENVGRPITVRDVTVSGENILLEANAQFAMTGTEFKLYLFCESNVWHEINRFSG